MSDFEQQQPPPVTDASSDGISAEQRQWAMFAHLSALVGGVITGGWAFSVGCFIGPLIIWMIKKDTMPFVDDQAKEALNFNLTVAAIFFVLLGQIVAAAVIDHFGWLGAIQTAMTPKRAIGIAVMALGLYLARKPA